MTIKLEIIISKIKIWLHSILYYETYFNTNTILISIWGWEITSWIRRHRQI